MWTIRSFRASAGPWAPSRDRSTDDWARLAMLAEAVLWCAAIWVVVFWRLGYASLLDPDEAHYAQITREMRESGRWFIPTVAGAPFIDKPVLFNWVQAASFAVFGVTEFAARLPSALAAIGLVAVTCWTGMSLFGHRVGGISGLMLLTMPATFALSSIGILDMLFAAFLYGAVACLIVSVTTERPRLQWLGFALLSLAIQVKGPVAVLVLAVAFLIAIVSLPAWRAPLLRMHWIAGPLLALAGAAPWFLWMWQEFGNDFVRHYFLEGNVWYVTTYSHSARRHHLFYVRTVFSAFLPWSLLLISRGAALLASRGGPASGRGEPLLWVWIGAVLAVFSAASFKLDQYVYPAAPAIAIIAARAWVAAADEQSSSRWQRAGIIAIPAVLIVIGAAVGIGLWSLELRAPGIAVVFPAALIGGSLLFVLQLQRTGWRAPSRPTALVCTLVVASTGIAVIGFPLLERARPTAAVARWIASQNPQLQEVGVYRLQRWEASLRFYSKCRIVRLENSDQLTAFLQRHDDAYIVMLRRDYRALHESGVPLKIVFGRDAVVGTAGRWLRRQLWGRLVVVVADAPRANP